MFSSSDISHFDLLLREKRLLDFTPAAGTAARLFMGWFLGPESSGRLVAEGAEPLCMDVPLAAGRHAVGVVARRPTVAGIVRGIPEGTERWRDAFGS